MITARIAAQQATSNPKTGVMVRASLTGNSTHVFAGIDAGTPLFEERTTTGGATTYVTGSHVSLPYWVRVVRQGSVLTSQGSPDGLTWTTMGTGTIAMSSPAYVCLADESGNTGALCTSTCDHVSVMAAHPIAVTLNDGGSATINLLANITAPSGATLTVTNVTQGSAGSVVNNGDGTVTYTASPGYIRSDSFAYTVTDGLGDTATGIVTLNITGLTAFWQFNDGAGSSAADSTGNGYTGVLNNGPTWTTGTYGGALAFNGSNQFVSVSDTNVPTTSYAVSFWFKTSSSNGGLFEVNNSPTGPTGYDRDLWLSGGNLSAYVWNTEIIATSGLSLANGNWHQVVHTFGGTVGGQKLYVDGVLRASGTKANSDFNTETNINIGNSNMASQKYFNGTIDEVRLYNTALSSTAVTALYNDSAPTVATAAAALPNPANGPRTNLSVLGASSNGESTLAYTWAATAVPSGASAPSFSAYGSNAAKNAIAYFTAPGTYTLAATIADSNGFSTVSSVNVTVNSAQLVWTGSGGNSNWSTAGNWTGSWAPVGGDQLSFSASAANDFPSGTVFSSLYLVGNNIALTGNSIILTSGTNLAIYNSGTSNSIAQAIQLGSPAAVSIASGNLAINGAITGGYGVTMSGSGILSLTSAGNNYTGATTVNSGTLALAGASGSITSSASVTIASGATRTLSGANNKIGIGVGALVIDGLLSVTDATAHTLYPANITLNGGTMTSGVSVPTYGAFFVGANRIITANGGGNTINAVNFGINGGVTLTLNTPLSTDSLTASTTFFDTTPGAALAKTGLGQVTVTGANTYTGGTTVSGGTLQLGDGLSKDGSVAGNIVDNATLAFANPVSQTCGVVISGTGAVTVSGTGRNPYRHKYV